MVPEEMERCILEPRFLWEMLDETAALAVPAAPGLDLALSSPPSGLLQVPGESCSLQEALPPSAHGWLGTVSEVSGQAFWRISGQALVLGGEVMEAGGPPRGWSMMDSGV